MLSLISRKSAAFSSDLSSVGRSALVAGLLWAASVGGEIALRPQRPDGAVAHTGLFALCVGTSVVGSVFLFHAFLGWRESLRTPRIDSRGARFGSWCLVVGTVLLLAFALIALTTGLVARAVWEPSFLAFALGMVALLIGQMTLGLALRGRTPGSGGTWIILLVGGACILVALGVPADPWHDLGLFGLFASWIVLGLRFLSTGTSPVRPAREHRGSF